MVKELQNRTNQVLVKQRQREDSINDLSLPNRQERVAIETEVKIYHAESPCVLSASAPIERFTAFSNDRIAFLTNTVYRWWSGGYGDRPGEDVTLRDDMRQFTEVALEYIPAKFLVRVFSHLTKGGSDCLQSAVGVIKGSSRKKPDDGPLEKAIAAQDSGEVQRLEAYLRIVEKCCLDPDFRPLAFLESWRIELVVAVAPEAKKLGFNEGKALKFSDRWATRWCDAMVDDAAQYLRHHVKLLKTHEADEASRIKELQKIKDSPLGKRYLMAQSQIERKHNCTNLPRNRKKRMEILTDAELALYKWQSARIKSLKPAKDLHTLLHENKALSDYVAADIRYRTLTKPLTPPTWTPITAQNPRRLFITSNLFQSPLTWNEQDQCFQTTILCPVIDNHSSNQENVNPVRVEKVVLRLDESAHFRRSIVEKDPWHYQWQDEISENMSSYHLKGLRFDDYGKHYCARLSFEKVVKEHGRLKSLRDNLKDKRTLEFMPGDIFCSVVLSPQLRGGKKGRAPVGWFRVAGVTKQGVKILDNSPLYSGKQYPRNKRVVRRGATPYFVREGQGSKIFKPARKRPGQAPTLRGQDSGITLRQLVDVKKSLDRAVRLLRCIKDPERSIEAIEWLTARRDALAAAFEKTRFATVDAGSAKERRAYSERANQQAAKLRQVNALIDKLSCKSTVLNRHDLKPYQREISSLRRRLSGMKATFRKTIAKQVVRQVHALHQGEGSSAVHKFVTEYKDQPLRISLLLVEATKGRGQGPFKEKRENFQQALFGASQITDLILEKAKSFGVPALSITTKSLITECPAGHTLKRGQSGPTVECASCGSKEKPRVYNKQSMKAQNLLERFITNVY